MTSQTYSKKDFMSDQIIRWCPGCGDYSILSQVQTTFAELDIPKENFAVISGIGCSSRFPYYMNTYGFHTIHGRAPAFATGLKATRPELSVWVITGDGDALSIGGNHIAHVLRRNVDIQVLLFNNRIYGLTKGQYSPTSEVGKRTKSTPMGSIDHPFKPIGLALGAEATFVARTVDVDAKHMQETIRRAAAHDGTAFVEILQNCNIFNDGTWAFVTDRQTKHQHELRLVHGEPLRFGKSHEKGVALDTKTMRPVVIDDVEAFGVENLLVHDETNATMAYLLSQLKYPDYPTPVGVFRCVERPTYDSMMTAQIDDARKRKPNGSVQDLLDGGHTWTVE